ncbi:MAG TPA: hypothetical protein VEQ59_23785 [Polyangiaceae bacterium]|nr:hypothetical protein [Polyangiaceae bacterium]
MNVLATRVVLRERTLAEVFDLAFRFVVVRGGRKYLRLWLLSCAPFLAACIWLRHVHVDWPSVWALALAGFVIAQIPFTLSASRLLLADELELGGVLKAWLPKIPGQLFIHLASLLLLAASALMIIPLPFLAARLLHLTEISLLEGSGLIRAYERGGRLSRSRMAESIESCLLLLAVGAAFVLGAEVTGQAVQVDLLSFPAPSDSLASGGSWFSLFGFFAAIPFLATARFLAYIDGRTRREAWDVQLRFTELAKQATSVGARAA